MKNALSVPELSAKLDKLKGPGASKGLSIPALCKAVAEAEGRPWPPRAPVAQTEAAQGAEAAAPRLEYLSDSEIARLSREEQIAHHKQWAERLAGNIAAEGHTPQSRPPGDAGNVASRLCDWRGHAHLLTRQRAEIGHQKAKEAATIPPAPALHQKPAATKGGEAFRQPSDL